MSLTTCLYKVIAKVLYEVFFMKLSMLHMELFVQGRQIFDAMLIANEIVDKKRRFGEEMVVFKIDFKKAYDYVD